MTTTAPAALTADQTSTARTLLEDGASYREVARTLGVPRHRVMRALPGYGWSYRDAGTFTASMRWAR
ncbi:helix-turn-helix DNA binding domain protein [Gordonia phage Jojo24]|uniref:Helix-turn-helix DNA binding domain protein n=1 Tax=Gordonia phage Jojo24 TaxID=2859476 RepID=A0AAE7VHS6_9CAUD|nr:helix-turn-helix DNA binding domain protein [Gordonia phage Jojo24]QXO13149.1 helix-turn-helix DNA binding domain protein [Gordonia phage Jojo24]